MPVSTGGKNKQKKWRKEAEFVNAALGVKHKGRQAKLLGQQPQYAGTGPVAPELLVGMFERAGIIMPKAIAFRDALRKLEAEKAETKEEETV